MYKCSHVTNNNDIDIMFLHLCGLLLTIKIVVASQSVDNLEIGKLHWTMRFTLSLLRNLGNCIPLFFIKYWIYFFYIII